MTAAFFKVEVQKLKFLNFLCYNHNRDKKQSAALETISQTLNRIADAQERMVTVVEKQKPIRPEQIMTMIATIATGLELIVVADIIVKWLGA
jgi:16S rRNA G1207 methylase RsmC